MTKDVVQFIIAVLFFLMLGLPPAVFLATSKIENPFTGVIVLYEDPNGLTLSTTSVVETRVISGVDVADTEETSM